MSNKRIWVVKAGSKMVCDGGPKLIRTWMKQVKALQDQHQIKVIWVTSGAIASAALKTNFKSIKRTLQQKQALSAIGQPVVMDQYNHALKAAGLIGAQVLLTAADMTHKGRRKNLLNTLQQLLKWRVVPILNENDAVATEEIQFGDNDSLAAQVAVMMQAERLVLLTDVDGLFAADPKTNPGAELIEYIKRVSARELNLAPPKAKSSVGTGGMHSKLLAAKTAQKAGLITHFLRGDRQNNLLKIAAGQKLGTQIGGQIES